MDNNERVQQYKQRANQLLDWAEQAYQDIGYTLQRDMRPLRAEHVGPYEAPGATVFREGDKVAEFKPQGPWIIGGEGRMDIEGSDDTAILVYMGEGGPVIRTTVSVEGDSWDQKSEKKLYKDVDKEGWYWIRDKQLGKTLPVTPELLTSLLGLVCGDES
ncbi:MAG: hypothetical protein ACOCVM_01440 [Desulfovibrionaceae bacterium]